MNNGRFGSAGLSRFAIIRVREKGKKREKKRKTGERKTMEKEAGEQFTLSARCEMQEICKTKRGASRRVESPGSYIDSNRDYGTAEIERSLPAL